MASSTVKKATETKEAFFEEEGKHKKKKKKVNRQSLKGNDVDAMQKTVRLGTLRIRRVQQMQKK